MDLYGNTFRPAAVDCNFSFAEVVENEKDELLKRLLNVYFKDTPVIYDILKDEEKWEGFFHELVNDDDAKEAFEEHFYRQLTHRYAGTLYGRTTVKPEKIVRQIALFVGTYYIALYIKTEESYLTPEQKLKCANTMLKIEIRSLGKDLERRDDLCDDLMNEVFRHQRKIDKKASENDELLLKNKSRLAKINILKDQLKNFANPPKTGSTKEPSSAKSTPAKTAKGEKKEGKKKAEKEKPPSSSSSENEDWLYEGYTSGTSSMANPDPFKLDYTDRNSDSGIEHTV